MKTKIENETVKPAGIAYPALFRGSTGDIWLQIDSDGEGVCLHCPSKAEWDVGAIECEPLQDNDDYTHIPGPLTITFNAP
jgi:hypothetical protein